MESLNAHINTLKNDLNDVIYYLNEIDDEDFSDKFSLLNQSINIIQNKREQLLSNYSREDLKKFNNELDFFIKQIVEKFDNKIEIKKSQQKVLSAQLQSTLNQKKLANYQR
jgi:t-SNARE complex subunit (syntaxin)